MPSMTHEPNIYELSGGDAPFRRLVESFYARVEHDPLIGIARRTGDEARIELYTGNYERIHDGMFLLDEPLAANVRATAGRSRQSEISSAQRSMPTLSRSGHRALVILS